MKNRLLVLITCLICSALNLFAQETFLISEGGSTDCTGLLFDTGGPDGDYGEDEDFSFVICPTGNSECIEFSLTYYNIENLNLEDNLRIFDGDVNNDAGREIAAIGGLAGGDGSGEVEGGVCFRTFATSGCISIVFQSDGQGNEAGFAGSWNCAPAACDDAQPIRVDPNVDALTIGEAIRGPGTVISNIVLNCPSGQYGVFSGDNSDLGLETGILLTTGVALDAIGPNIQSDEIEISPGREDSGDSDLEALGGLLGDLTPTFDACVLELDVIVDTDELVFDYTFGSEEYPEFVENAVNDIFAFFISGPGIDGVAELNGQENIAVLDNGNNTVVQIDSINGESNNEYYRNNILGQSVSYDGLTSGLRGNPKTLRARADVIACETYHLKLAIADRGDGAYDSGVFIAGLCGGLPNIGVTMTSGIDYLLEDCLNVSDSIKISFNNVKSVPQFYQLQISGSAEINQDYLLPGLPETIVFQPGRNILTLPIIIIGDGLEEGEEEIVFSFVTDFGCDVDVDVSTIAIPLRDDVQVTLESTSPTGPLFYCPGSTFDIVATGASNYVWSSGNGVIIATGDTTSYTPNEDGPVRLIGTVGSCMDTLDFLVEAISSEVDILNPDTLNICRGDTVILTQTNNVNNQELRWLTTSGFIDSDTSAAPRVVPPFSRFYAVTVGPDGGCSARDSIYVDVDVFAVPELINDTTVCQGYPLLLVRDSILNVGNTTYNWTPGELFEDSTDVNAAYNPETYSADNLLTLISTVDNGACSDTQQVRVELIRSELAIIAEDTIFRCLGDGPETLTASAIPADGVTLRWYPDIGATGPNNEVSYTVDPTDNVTYYVEAEVNGCFQIDSVFVRIDSLPVDMTMTIDPEKDPFCQGDTFFIRSPIFDPGDFPLITHSWDEAPGLASPEQLYNGVFFAADSALMTRVTENGACMRTDTLQVNVIKPPILIFDPDPAFVCPGDELQIMVSFDPSGPRGELEWEDPGNTLSCDDCLDPVATVSESTTYTIEVTAEGTECSMPVGYSINIREDGPPQLTGATVICSGDSGPVIVGGIDPDFTYRIVGGGIDSDDPNVVVTPPADNTTYTVTATGPCGTFTDEVTFLLVDDYTLTATGPGTVCGDEEATLTARLSNDTQGTFTWTLPDGTTREGIQITVSPEVSGTYSVTFTDGAGCGSATATTTVNVVGVDFLPTIIATTFNDAVLMQGDTIFSGARITLTVGGIPAGLDVRYAWSGNYDPSTGTGESLVVTAPREDGGDLDYMVTVTTNEGDCPRDADIGLTYVESTFKIPELITPNGDGTNDFFRVYAVPGSLTEFNLSVFNRWGQRVFESSDPDEGWDGTKNGTPQNSDLYLYLTTFTINGLEVTEDGQFNLVR